MNLATMRGLVRRDLKDENPSNYRWTDNEIDRAITRAVVELSKYSPREMKSTLATVSNSAEIDIASLTGKVSIDRVEFPIDQTPRAFNRFEVYATKVILLETKGDGSNCYVYWSSVHTLDAGTSSIPSHLEDLVVLGATAFATLAQSQYSTDKANYGGENVDRDFLYWAKGRLMDFEAGLKKLKKKLKINVMYTES